MNFMSFALTGEKILAFYWLETFANTVLFINANDMKILQLDAFWQDDFNELLITKIQSLVVEIMQLKVCQNFYIINKNKNTKFT